MTARLPQHARQQTNTPTNAGPPKNRPKVVRWLANHRKGVLIGLGIAGTVVTVVSLGLPLQHPKARRHRRRAFFRSAICNQLGSVAETA